MCLWRKLGIILGPLIGMFTFTACFNSNVGGHEVIDIEKGMKNAVPELVLQDYFTDVQYVPLETNDSSLIGDQADVMVLEKMLLVSSVNQPLKAFDRVTGKYLYEIGHIGNDPEGYAKDEWGKINYWVDANGGKIYFMGWNNDFQLYDLNGGYWGKLQMPIGGDFNIAQNYFLMNADTIWGHNKLHLSEGMPSVFYIQGKIPQITGIYSWPSSLLPMDEVVSLSNLLGGYVAHGGDLQMVELTGGRKYYTAINSPSLWRQGGAIRLKQAFNDTIYTVSADRLVPYKRVNLGKWHWQDDASYQVDGCKDRIYIDYVLENDRYIYFHFQTGLYTKSAKSYCAFYDKMKKVVSVGQSDKILERSHNLTVQIRNVSADGCFVALLSSEKLNTEERDRLKVSEEDNPVVVILQ